jgi:2-polyprenyl-3-methyl-5-hydroxy-6-metoxy-1,4-benzoquinol methylase
MYRRAHARSICAGVGQRNIDSSERHSPDPKSVTANAVVDSRIGTKVGMYLSTKIILVSVSLPILLYVVHLATDRRSYALERQDKSETEGNYTRAQYMELMHMLAEANIADPNGHAATLSSFNRLKKIPDSIMEVGFGLGHFSVMLASRYQNSTVMGIDAHQLSVDAANQFLDSLPNPPENVRFESRRESQLNETPKSVDVITTTLVNHHIFPDEQFVEFLRRIAVIGRQAFIFNDMHRSFKCLIANDINMMAVKHLGVDGVTKLAQYLPESLANTVLRYQHVFAKRSKEAIGLFADGGMLSMRRSFTLYEYKKLFKQAGYPEGALQCRRLDHWYQTLDATCRVVCIADLTWSG